MRSPRKPRVLVVDDDLAMAQMLADGLEDHGYAATPLASGRRAIELLAEERFDAIVTDLRMPDADGLQVLAASQAQSRERPVIIMTAYSAIDTAVDSIRQGAYHYLTKPFKTDELVIFLGRALDEIRLRREAKAMRSALRERLSARRLIGTSQPLQAVRDIIERVADSPLPVLITGETGTGKGLVAGAIHGDSARAPGAFVTVNCAALPEALLESELFGHVKGAFTGATDARPGLFTEASGGSLFLDEIGDMALPLQAKLLHVIESGVVRPVGGEKPHAVDVRLIAATNRDLRAAVAAGTFREDLLYRLDVVTIEIPPLRHRREDILPLVHHFLAEAKSRHPQSPVERFARETLDRLVAYRWPGNVRELAHVMEKVVVLGRAAEVGLGELPPALLEEARGGGFNFRGDVIPMRELQRRYSVWALEQLGGHKGRTAELLGIDGKTLAKWLAAAPGEEGE
jgi:two-component system response regulator HydG